MGKMQGSRTIQMRPSRRAASKIPTVAAPIPLSNDGAPTVPYEVRDDSEAISPSVDAQLFPNFVPNEIVGTHGAVLSPPDIAELIGSSDFEDDLLRAKRQEGSALYVCWRDKLTESLSLAYALYLHVLLDPEKLKRLFEEPYFSNSRQRALPKKKVALAALQYVTKPKAEDDRKSASAYATVLVYARHKGLTVQRFAVEMPNVTLQEARAFVRDLRQENASKREKVPAKPTLTISYRSGTAHRRHVLEGVSFSTASERQSLTELIVKTLHEAQD
jgi:hypothetical protein